MCVTQAWHFCKCFCSAAEPSPYAKGELVWKGGVDFGGKAQTHRHTWVGAASPVIRLLFRGSGATSLFARWHPASPPRQTNKQRRQTQWGSFRNPKHSQHLPSPNSTPSHHMHPRARNKPGVPFVFYKRTSESLWREEVRHNFLFLPSPFKSLTHPVQGHVSSQKAFATSLRLICDVRLRGFFFFSFSPSPFSLLPPSRRCGKFVSFRNTN